MPRTLSGQLLLILISGAVALWFAGIGLAAVLMQHQFDQAFDGGLRETAERLLPLAEQSLQDYHEDEDERIDADGGEYIVYQLRTRSGVVAGRSHDAPHEPFAAPLVAGFATDGNWRIFTFGNDEGTLFVQAAEALQHRRDTLLGLLATLLLPLAGFVLLATIGIILAVRHGLRPVARLTAEVAERHPANLAPLRLAGLPDDLRPLGQAIQGLLAQLRAALEAERAFVANSAHELRTPISGSLAQVQQLLHEAPAQPLRPRLERVEASLTQLSRLVEKLSHLSRADAGMALSSTRIDLLPVLAFTLDEARLRHAEDGEIRLTIASGATLTAEIDIDAFGIVMRNLLENAQLYRRPGTDVVVRVPARNVLEVENACDPVTPEFLLRLKDRFARGDSDLPGSGLGLSIVETIMRQLGGELELLSPAPGRRDGFCARLRFV